MSVLASSRSRGRLDPDVRAETNTKRRLVTSLVFVLGLPWAWEHIPAPSLEEGEGQLWSVALYMLTVAIDCFNSLQVQYTMQYINFPNLALLQWEGFLCFLKINDDRKLCCKK